MKSVIKALTILVSALLLFGSAAAHPQTVLDPDDTPGPLDLSAARHGHRVVTRQAVEGDEKMRRTVMKLKLVTYDTWGYQTIAGGKNFAGFEFNLDHDAAIERCAIVDSQDPQERGGREVALAYEVRIYAGCNYFDDKLIKSYEAGNAGQPDPHTLRVTVPKRVLLGRGIGTYRWRAVTSFQEEAQNSPCPAPEPHADGGYGTCFDATRWDRHDF